MELPTGHRYWSPPVTLSLDPRLPFLFLLLLLLFFVVVVHFILLIPLSLL